MDMGAQRVKQDAEQEATTSAITTSNNVTTATSRAFEDNFGPVPG